MPASRPGTLHFIAGSTGAGKTTYAKRVTSEVGGVRFAVDEWMQPLFWVDATPEAGAEWALERIERCRALIWQTAVDVARAGVPCLLELGFTTRAVRNDYAERAAALNMPVRLHFVDVPAEERWRRVEGRNVAGDGALAFPITRELFDYVEAMWEPPGDDELTLRDGLRVWG